MSHDSRHQQSHLLNGGFSFDLVTFPGMELDEIRPRAHVFRKRTCAISRNRKVAYLECLPHENHAQVGELVQYLHQAAAQSSNGPAMGTEPCDPATTRPEDGSIDDLAGNRIKGKLSGS